MTHKSVTERSNHGGPGIEPRWTHGSKMAVGTAYSSSSHVWYTLDASCVTEVYYPTIGTPQMRDLQFLFTDAETLPLLTGERGHYEIAAGRDAGPYLRALENFSQAIGLIPE